MTTEEQTRLDYTTEYLTEQLSEALNQVQDGQSFIKLGENTIGWIDTENIEVWLITIQPAKFEVST